MKIVHIQVIPQMAGVQQISFDILNSIKDVNVKKYLICGEEGEAANSFVDKFESIGVNVILVKDIKRAICAQDLVAFWRLYKLFRIEKFDIVHSNSTKPGIIARVAARLAGVKLVVHTVHGIAFHDRESYMKRSFFYILENFCSLFGHVNVSVNKYYTRYYPLTKTKVIYNGVDFSCFNVSRNSDESCNTVHFAFFARLDEQKNPLEYIRAIKIFVDAYQGDKTIKFTLAGNGSLMGECKNLIEQLQLSSHIDVSGWITDKNSFLNNVDVICQPSEWEAFGLVFVEAAFFGIPSIAKNVEGVSEVVIDGKSGLLYQGDQKDLAKKMLQYANDFELITEHGNCAKQNAINNFSVERMSDEYKKIYFSSSLDK